MGLQHRALHWGADTKGLNMMDAGHLAPAQVPQEDAQEQTLVTHLTDFP